MRSRHEYFPRLPKEARPARFPNKSDGLEKIFVCRINALFLKECGGEGMLLPAVQAKLFSRGCEYLIIPNGSKSLEVDVMYNPQGERQAQEYLLQVWDDLQNQTSQYIDIFGR